MYIAKQFEFIFVPFKTSKNAYFDKIITTDSPKSYTPVKNVYFTQILSIVLAIFAYYAGIMLNAFVFLLCSNYAGIIGSSLVPSKIATFSLFVFFALI